MEVSANMLEAVEDVRVVGPNLLTLEQLGQAFECFKTELHDSFWTRTTCAEIHQLSECRNLIWKC